MRDQSRRLAAYALFVAWIIGTFLTIGVLLHALPEWILVTVVQLGTAAMVLCGLGATAWEIATKEEFRSFRLRDRCGLFLFNLAFLEMLAGVGYLLTTTWKACLLPAIDIGLAVIAVASIVVGVKQGVPIQTMDNMLAQKAAK